MTSGCWPFVPTAAAVAAVARRRSPATETFGSSAS